MSKKISALVIILILVVLTIAVSMNQTSFMVNQQGEVCSDVFCNDFNFVCCNENPIATTSSVSQNYVTCPTSATKCQLEVTPLSYPNNAVTVCSDQPYSVWYVGYGGWTCNQKIRDVNTQQASLSPGEYAIVRSSGTFKAFSQRLDDCGRAGCSQGLPVQGASGCTFVTDKSVYDSSGNLLRQPTGSGLSYTVPYGTCYLYTSYSLRRVCGSTCESCQVNSDCASNYPYTYAYNGQTYGATCQSGYVQLYGCKKQTGVCLEFNTIFGQDTCVNSGGEKSWCEQVVALPVQCCPGTDSCGPNAICNSKTFTCSQTSECTQDYDCGTVVSCDRASTSLKQKQCVSGSCQSVFIKDVDCCYDTDCSNGWYCSSEYKCLQKPDTKTDCPYGCCANEEKYFDKNCPSDFPVCCGDHTCSASAGECSVKPVEKSLPWDIILPALIAAGAFMLSLRKFEDEESSFRFGMSAIIAALVAIATWWVVTNWLLVLILGIGAGAIYVLFAIGLIVIAGPLLILGGKK